MSSCRPAPLAPPKMPTQKSAMGRLWYNSLLRWSTKARCWRGGSRTASRGCSNATGSSRSPMRSGRTCVETPEPTGGRSARAAPQRFQHTVHGRCVRTDEVPEISRTETKLHPRDRLPYSPITRRPPLRLPDGVRLVVWPLLALEEWDLARPMARMVISPPQGQPQMPDLPNWSWHEYGMRVGFWRLKKMLEQFDISPTVTLNAKVCETYPQVIEACMTNGWELNAHSYDQVPMHKLDDQRAIINK